VSFDPDLRDLYQSVILDHHKKPRNFHTIEGASRHAEGYNPLCGDKISVYVKMDGDIIKDVSFVGSGCAISTAAASMMTESLKGKTRAQAAALFEQFHELVTGATALEGETGRQEDRETRIEEKLPLGKLAVFGGVREFPIRIKCATLPWHTLQAALKGDEVTISTE
jgi:nitrogen fixation NifU-like protein